MFIYLKNEICHYGDEYFLLETVFNLGANILIKELHNIYVVANIQY